MKVNHALRRPFTHRSSREIGSPDKSPVARNLHRQRNLITIRQIREIHSRRDSIIDDIGFQCVRSTVDPKHISQVRPCLRGLTRRQPRSVSSHAGRDHLSTRSKATSTAHIADPKSCAYHENSLSKAGDHDSKNIRYLQKAAQRLDGRTDPSFGIAKPNDGFTTVPRTMPIAKQAIDAQTKGRPAGRTLFGLWARAPDSPSLTATSLCLLPSAQRALEPTMTSLT